jgi:hypothetical protein
MASVLEPIAADLRYGESGSFGLTVTGKAEIQLPTMPCFTSQGLALPVHWRQPVDGLCSETSQV